MKVKSESEVAQSCLTQSDPMDCSPPGSSIHGIFQARVLEWGAIAFSREVPLDVTYRISNVSLPTYELNEKKKKKSLIKNVITGMKGYLQLNEHLKMKKRIHLFSKESRAFHPQQ